MKYISLSLKYVFKNFPRLLVFACLPALLMAFCYDLPAFAWVLRDMWSGEKVSFDMLYRNISLFANRLWWLRIVTLLLFVLVMGILLSTIDRHMRIGKFSFGFWHRIDEVLFNVTPMALLAIVITEVFALLISCLVMLVALIFPLGGLPYVTVILLLSMLTLWGLVIVLFVNCVPCMLVQGYPMGEALGCSVRMVTKQLGRLLLAFLFPFLVLIPLELLAGAYLGAWHYVVYFLCFAFMIMYYSAFSMSSYFEIFGYERQDIRYKLFK